jgi:predicted ATP-grasp superfamily ATP-dependent carboligase
VSWRAQMPVMVVEAQTTGAIAVIRSLGRAGYPVHAVSHQASALGLRSRFASTRAVAPHHAEPRFCEWLASYVRANHIEAIVPSESLLLAIRPVHAELAPLLPTVSDADLLYAGMNKFDLFNRLAGAAHLPPTLLLPDTRALPSMSALSKLGAPLYVKSDGGHATQGEAGAVYACATADEALERIHKLAPRFSKLLVQGHVDGQGVGAFFLAWKGEVLAEFMHRRIHEVPHTGGASSLRESWFHPAIREDALQKLRAMQWEGVAMMEYRWDAESERFHFLEMNGRFWGSLHLALAAGVDFPRLLLDAFFGRSARTPADFPLGLRCRHTFPMEVEYLGSRLKDSQLSTRARLWSALEFVLLGADPRVRSDLLFAGDRGLYFEGLRRFAGEFF